MRNLWINCRGRIQRALLTLLASLAVYLAAGLPVHAQILYTNSDTGYQVYIEDDAKLLSQEEIESLAQQMQGITA
ncbi:MAG: hypothetical protein K2K19_03460 [Acetatifactor sp.]|nr:hypothetical protein [Acetatifactor sp.]